MPARWILVLLLVPVAAFASPPPCPGGYFAFTDDLLDLGGVLIADGTAEIPGECPPTAVRTWRSGRRTLVRGQWESCASGGPVALRARIDGTCDDMTGRLRRLPGGPRHRFTARRVPPDDAPRCGTILGIDCPKDHFCELPPHLCGGADMEGVCVPMSPVCLQFYAPVCGCDGRTYGNDCERRAAQVQKDHDGRCGSGCTQACDCYRLPFSYECLLLCPNCGNYWTCEKGECVERCGPVPIDDVCPAF